MNGIYQRIAKVGKARLIGMHPSGTAEWLEQRKNTIGGSDIAPILNKSPWTSCYALWARKTGLIPEQPTNDRMQLGNLFEPAIAEMYKLHHPDLTLHYPGHTWESLTNERFHANPDGFVENAFGDTSILEIKYTSQYWRELPEQYRLQVLWYQHVTGLTNDAVVAVVSPQGYSEFAVIYDKQEAATIQGIVERFLDNVDAKVEPQLDTSESTYEAIRDVYSEIADQEIQIDPNEFEALQVAVAQSDTWAGIVRLRKSQIMKSMKGCIYGLIDNQRVVSLRTRGEGKPYLVIEKD
jgi:putative phage-type endonuclease